MCIRDSKYTIKVVSQKNPLRITLPIAPGINPGRLRRVLTIDACTFVVDQVAPYNLFTISPTSDKVRLVFNNGFGVYEESGKMTKLL